MDDRFSIVDYRPVWPAEFRHIAARIRSVLDSRALRIDHIGSTSVPGLCSKDVIDLQVAVADLTCPTLTASMIGARFVPRPNILADHIPPGDFPASSEWEKRYFREPSGERVCHVHVRVLNRRNQRYALLFRDYLRQHPTAAAAYGLAKRRMAAGLTRSQYVDAKDPVCDLIIQAAEVWANDHWRPGPSDG